MGKIFSSKWIKKMINNKPIIIVGAGLAGLTAAAYLSRKGEKVVLVEKNDECGGLLNSFEYQDFTFDVGARSIENSGVIKPMLKDLGIDIELLNSKVSIGIESDIFPFTSLKDIDAYKKLLKVKFINNTKDIDKIFKVINKITKSMKIMYGFDNPIFTKDFTKNKKYLIHELLPWFPKFLYTIMQMNRMNQPIDEFLQKYTKNQSLIDMISQHFFKKTPTFFALGYFYVYQDYIYPKGGTGELSKKLYANLINNGVKIINNTTINAIHPNKKTLIDQNNNSYEYSKLIWASDLSNFYSILNISKLDKKTKTKTLKEKEKISNSRGGDSVFSLYLGVNLEKEYFSAISNGHFFYTPKKEGLNNIHYKKLNYLINNFESLSKSDILNWVYKYCELNTYEISIPILRDSNLAPKGKTGVIANIFFEYDLVKKIEKAGWYNEFKTLVENKIIEILNNSVYKNLKENILFKFSFTPISIENRVKTAQGAITGWTYEKPSPVVNNIIKMPKSIKTPINDIYQVGQWAYSPAGIPTAIISGWYAADNIIKNIKKE